MVYRRRHYPAVLAGATLLAGIAGIVNLVGLLSVTGIATSHMTGAVSALSLSLVGGHILEIERLILIILSFLLGALISGFSTGSHRLDFRRRYGLLLILEATLLMIAERCYDSTFIVPAEALTAMACGLQNAMVTTVSGAVVRTTHLTGIITDLGIQLGRLIRGDGWQPAQFILHAGILAGFFLGGMAGAWGYSILGSRILQLVAGLLFGGGLVYFILRRQIMRNRNQGEALRAKD